MKCRLPSNTAPTPQRPLPPPLIPPILQGTYIPLYPSPYRAPSPPVILQISRQLLPFPRLPILLPILQKKHLLPTSRPEATPTPTASHSTEETPTPTSRPQATPTPTASHPTEETSTLPLPILKPRLLLSLPILQKKHLPSHFPS